MRRRLRNALIAVLFSAMPAMPLMAQTYEAPGPPEIKEKSVAKEWLIGSIFLVGCLVVAFKPAKRANLR